MKMDVRVTVEQSKLDEAMNKVEEAVCEEWFEGNKEAYEKWAGDRVSDALWAFVDSLEHYCHVQIDPCEDKYFDLAFGD